MSDELDVSSWMIDDLSSNIDVCIDWKPVGSFFNDSCLLETAWSSFGDSGYSPIPTSLSAFSSTESSGNGDFSAIIENESPGAAWYMTSALGFADIDLDLSVIRDLSDVVLYSSLAFFTGKNSFVMRFLIPRFSSSSTRFKPNSPCVNDFLGFFTVLSLSLD